MTRKEIVDILRDMQLTYYKSKNRAHEKWQIPNERAVIRIMVVLESDNMLSSFSSAIDPTKERWMIGITANGKETFYPPKVGIDLIRVQIMRQFEIFARKDEIGKWQQQTYSQTWSSWETLKPVPEERNNQFYKPERLVRNMQKSQYKLKTRSSYSGKR